MTITSNFYDTVMVTRYQIGTTAGGAPIIRQKSLAGLKENVTDEDLYEVAQTLFDLLQYPLMEVRRSNTFILTNE